MYLDLINRTLCKDRLSKLWSLGPKGEKQEESQHCAGSLTYSIDTCSVGFDLFPCRVGCKCDILFQLHGNSGGPLQTYHPSLICMITVIGVTSFGIAKCGQRQPGVYSRVSHYLDWIEGIVWPMPRFN